MHNDDLLTDENESRSASDRQLPATTGNTALKSNQNYEPTAPQSDEMALLPGQVLISVMEKVRTTMLLVGWFYSALGFLLAVGAIILLAPGLFWLTDKSSPILINFAQVAISLVSIGLALGCVVIAFYHVRLKNQLVEAEGLIDNIRDRAFLQMQATRYNLEDLTEKLAFPKEKNSPTPFDYIDVAKKVGPLLALWNSKERSLVTLGVEGLKFYQSLKKILNK